MCSRVFSLFHIVCGLILTCIMSAVFVHAATPQPGYPVPQIVGPTNPTAVAPGGSAFTLRVFGANCGSGKRSTTR